LSDALGHGAENRSWLDTICPGFSLHIDAAITRGTLRQHNRALALADLVRVGG
jgi:hypothetical protein